MDAALFMSALGRSPQAGPADTVEKLYGLGYWLYGQERFADAALAFRTMLRTAPSDERSWLALGSCHERINQFRIALELYGTGSAIVPTSVRCQLARVRVLKQMDRESEAQDALEMASRLAEEQGDDELIRLVRAEGRT